jgi:hypothetical protein
MMPYAPISFIAGDLIVVEQALLDTGASVNVLPWRVGVALGFDWEAQTSRVTLSGNLAASPARIVALRVQLGTLPPARLVFAWTQAEGVPVLLGQVNFFIEFEVCFHRQAGHFEVRAHR